MTDQTPKLDDRYRRYVVMLCRHHDLLGQAVSDDQLESIEGEMTELWNELDIAQQRSLSGLSSDLNWLRRGGQLAPKAKRANDVPDDDLRELAQARSVGDWHKLLHFLRLAGAKLSPFEIAFMRATAWQGLGFAELSRMFSALAGRLEPQNASLAIFSLPAEGEIRRQDHAEPIG